MSPSLNSLLNWHRSIRLVPVCGAGLQGLVVLALLVPGCAGKRIDLLSSRLDTDAAETDEAETDSAASDSVSDPLADDHRLLAAKASRRPLTRLSAFTRRNDDGPSQDSFARRFRAILDRDAATESIATADPFLDSDEGENETASLAEGKIVPTKATSVDDLLAKITRRAPEADRSDTKPWWEQESPAKAAPQQTMARRSHRFASEFDSRLEQLRAELASLPCDATGSECELVDTSRDVNPFAQTQSTGMAERAERAKQENPFARYERLAGASPDLAPKAEPAAIQDAGSLPVVLGQVEPPSTELYSLPYIVSRKSRQEEVRAMIAAARNERDNGNLRRAYRIALDAQALAVFRNIKFAPSEQHPEDLAEQIAKQLQQQPSTPAQVPETRIVANTTANPLVRNNPAFSSLGFPEFSPTAGHWETWREGPQIIPNRPSMDLAGSGDESGVSLFPPDDDFPSDAESPGWENHSSPLAEFLSEKGIEASEGIQLTIHEGSDEVNPFADPPADDNQFRRLTEEDNQESLAHASDQRTREFDVKKPEWPSLPTLPESEPSATSVSEPIRVAQAPHLTMQSEMSAEATKGMAVVPTPENGSLLSQIWRSQPIWFVGGLLLLVIALRLLRWPKGDSL